MDEDISIVTDKNGDTMRVKHYDGINYSVTGAEGKDMKTMLSQVIKFTSRPDDVIIATYPKSGTNWVYCIVYMLLHHTAKYPPFECFINGLSEEEYANLPSPRQFASHFVFKYLPKDVFKKGAKVINVIRNPKDTAVSMYSFLLKMKEEGYKGSWDGYLDIFLNGESLFGSWFQYVKEWEDARKQHPENILQLKYEDLVLDMRGNIKKIADFIKVPYEEDFLDEITEKCRFANMKNSRVADEFWETHSIDGKNPLWRKGVIGDWKNWFTVSQNEQFDNRLQQEMSEYSMQFIYESPLKH